MKKRNVLSLSCFLMMVCLLITACPRVINTTGSACGSTQRRCTIIIIPHPFAETELNGQSVSNSTGILDLANPWEPDTSQGSYATVKITRANGQIVQSNFTTQLSSNIGVSSVDKDTTPYFYVFQDPSAVNSFVSQSLSGNGSDVVTIDFISTIMQSDCTIPSGKYINHVRYNDTSGVSYLDSFNLNYSVPDNIQGENRCEQATITFED